MTLNLLNFGNFKFYNAINAKYVRKRILVCKFRN